LFVACISLPIFRCVAHRGVRQSVGLFLEGVPPPLPRLLTGDESVVCELAVSKNANSAEMMKKLGSLILFAVLYNSVSAQTISDKLLTALSNDTTAFRRFIQSEKELGLPPLTNVGAAQTYRLWSSKSTANMVLQIDFGGPEDLRGILKLYCDGNSFSESKARLLRGPHTFYQDFQLSADTLSRIISLLKQLDKFPTGNDIPNWNKSMVDDGWGLALDYADSSTVKLKNWGNPDVHNEWVNAGGKIDSLASKLFALIQINRYSSEFLDALPRGVYSNGSVNWISSFKNNRERHRFHRIMKRRRGY
jgi:hypothetical protein